MSTFGQRLRIAIEQHQRMTVTAFSERTGFDLPHLSHMLHDNRLPSFASLAMIINALPGTNVGWLITGEPR